MSIIFLDMEGARVEEMAAIQMNAGTLQIMDVFHAFAKATCQDDWARRHCHGLSKDWLENNAEYENEKELIEGFRKWLRGKNVIQFFANNPSKEKSVLGDMFVPIHDLQLREWEVRDSQHSHNIALDMKRKSVPVLHRRCLPEVHSSFQKVAVYSCSAKDRAKERAGYHCALYDTAELLYYYYSITPGFVDAEKINTSYCNTFGSHWIW